MLLYCPFLPPGGELLGPPAVSVVDRNAIPKLCRKMFAETWSVSVRIAVMYWLSFESANTAPVPIPETEAIASGCAQLVGTGTREIVGAATRVLDDPAVAAAMSRPAFPFGDGTAAARIVDILSGFPFPRA